MDNEKWLGSRHRLRDSRATEYRNEDFLRLLDALWRRAEREHVPCVSGPARRAAGLELARGRAWRAGCARARLAAQRAFDLRAEKLFLSGLAEGLSNLAIRPAVLGTGRVGDHDGRAR